jgi:hypothetical protein
MLRSGTGSGMASSVNGTAPTGPSNRIDVIDTAGGRILCVADVRGEFGVDL